MRIECDEGQVDAEIPLSEPERRHRPVRSAASGHSATSASASGSWRRASRVSRESECWHIHVPTCCL